MDKKPIAATIAAGAVLFMAGYWSAGGQTRLIEPAAAQSGPSFTAVPNRRHGDFCANMSDWRLEFAEKFIAVDLDLTAKQIALLDTLTASVRGTAARPDGICTLSAWTVDESNLSAAIVSAKTWIAAAQTALDDIEPSLNAFYGSLDAVQKTRLAHWMSEGHRRHRG